MTTPIPEPGIARGSAFAQPGAVDYRGTPETVGNFTAVPPAPPQGTPGARVGKRVTGLVPAQAGAHFPLVLREPARVRIDPADVSRARADLRRAQSEARKAEALLLAAAGQDLRSTSSPGYVDAMKASRDANDLVAALTRKLAEMEAQSASRPIRVTLAKVREPSEVADLIGSDGEYVCLHDGCKGQRWSDEPSMRRAHPSDADMARTQQCHPFAVLCEAPIDPLDPQGEIVGLVATVGKDGTTIARAVAAEAEGDEIEVLRAANATLEERMARMEAMLAEFNGGAKAAKK